MNTKNILGALTLALLGTSAFAYEAMPVYETQDFGHTSTVTREQVKAELKQAIADGTMPVGGQVGYLPDGVTQPGVTANISRQDVRAEAREYVRSGQAYRDGHVSGALGN